MRCFNRFELKYLIIMQQAALFKQVLRASPVPDDHGNGEALRLCSIVEGAGGLTLHAWTKSGCKGDGY